MSRDAARIGAELAMLNASTDPFAIAVRATRMPMLITNPREADNPIVFANDAFCSLAGYSREETIGRNCRFLQGPATDPATVARIRDAVGATEPLVVDICNHRKNGEPFWNRLLIAPVRDANGTLIYYFSSQFDITSERERLASLENNNAALMAEVARRLQAQHAQQESEARLREANETLEARVAERTRELVEANNKLRVEAQERERVEAALRQSQKMEAIGQLTGGIAHDFNNMLQGIGGAVEIMRRRVEQGRMEEAWHFADTAGKTVERAAALAHRLLAFARRQALQPRIVEPNKLIGGMEDLVRRTVGPEIQLEVPAGDSRWMVLCDPNQLENVLLNLTINARDAMPKGGKLTISTQDMRLDPVDVAGQDGARAGDYVEVSVSDTGTGMDEATKARAFEPFFTTKPAGQGTGLGLSQLYGFVRQSDGTVRLDSTPGRGTTIRLYLPRNENARELEEQPMVGFKLQGAGKKGAVLLVEDESSVRAVVAERLRELGCTVLEAEDGPAALQLLRSDALVDVLVTDVGLSGGLNGRQVADMARECRPGLPVLFITGYAGSLLERQLAPGMQVIGKPFALDTLAIRVQAILTTGLVE